ncbi:MAG: hypothetical protein IKZ52_01630 [Bacteroidales bacterium]|nr:hypothetical protein [Bacteroidales bacterium]
MIELIKNLESINLAEQEAADKVMQELKKCKSYVLPIAEINEGYRIYRATILGKNETIITKKRLSYRSAKDNHNYQRASKPQSTAFYGTVHSEDNLIGTNKKSVNLALCEVSSLLRKPFDPNQIENAIIGEWTVTKKLSLFALAKTDETNKSSYFNVLGADFVPFLNRKGCFNDEIAKYNDFQEFITGEFNKLVAENQNHEYIISALFAEKLKQDCQIPKKIDGLIWQSTINKDPMFNDTLCVALFPESVAKLNLNRCYQTTIRPDNKCVKIGALQDITTTIFDI